MCGIAGIVKYAGVGPQELELIKRMNAIQKHRGPDDEGFFEGPHCILGHRRLSIIDLSAAGRQPFASEDGRYQLVYNGEIYNYIELRVELEKLGWNFKTKTDTEVLLKCYQHYGPQCLAMLNGMFAFCVYDTKIDELFLARDHVGIKPLYYSVINKEFYFASEIKALAAIPALSKSVNAQAVFDYFVFNRTDVHDETFLTEVNRIPKGHYAVFSRHGLKLTPWWMPESFLNQRIEAPLEKIIEELNYLMLSSVSLRLRADVATGSCLSGGVDSSILTGILRRQNWVGEDYPTFTVSFPGTPIDETRFVDSLRQKYKFSNYRVTPTAESVYNNLKEYVFANDDPTTDPSFYAQYELMKLAKANGVVVLQDGQGADEVFAGYQYFHGFYLAGLFKGFQTAAFLQEFLATLGRGQGDRFFLTMAYQMMPDTLRKAAVRRTAPFIEGSFFETHYKSSLISQRFFDAPDLNTSLLRHWQYKLEHLLRMEDRNSMAFSLEARLPYLDYRLMEYVLRLDDSLKIRQGETKYIQRKALGQYTVLEILKRKEKFGFEIPTQEWMGTVRWQKQIEGSAAYCQKKFPEVFTANLSTAKLSAETKWKLVQLSTWHQLFN